MALWKHDKAQPAIVVGVVACIQLGVFLRGPEPLLDSLHFLLFLNVALSLFLSACARLIEYPVDEFDIFLQELDGLRQQLVALLQIVGLLVAARDVVSDDTNVDRFHQDALLLVLDGQDLQRLLQSTKRLLEVAALLLLLLAVPSSALWLVQGGLLDL